MTLIRLGCSGHAQICNATNSHVQNQPMSPTQAMNLPMSPDDTALRLHLQALEIQLHDRPLRSDMGRLRALLHQDFMEFGRSGGVHAKADTVVSLAAEASPRLVADGFALVRLGPDSALLTYRSASLAEDGTAGRHALRSSVWLRTNLGWQMRFHQGTPTEPFAMDTSLR